MENKALINLSESEVVNLLGGLDAAKQSVRMAKIMRTMSVGFKDADGQQGQFWLQDVEAAIQAFETKSNE